MSDEKMTDEEIVRKLAVDGMGWTQGNEGEAVTGSGYVWDGEVFWSDSDSGIGVWNPLTSGDDMLMVVEAMREKGWEYDLGSAEIGPHCAEFTRPDDGSSTFDAVADTAQRAVCLAAVKALNDIQEKT